MSMQHISSNAFKGLLTSKGIIAYAIFVQNEPQNFSHSRVNACIGGTNRHEAEAVDE